jgi:hypothetical protein
MCLDNIRLPTKEEREKTYIGYKIVQKAGKNFRPTISQVDKTLYKLGQDKNSSRKTIKLTKVERQDNSVYEGIHFYLNPEVEQCPFKKDNNYSLIKIEVKGKDIIAFGDNPYQCLYPCRNRTGRPSPCPNPYRCRYIQGAVAIKIKVLEEIKEETDETGGNSSP